MVVRTVVEAVGDDATVIGGVGGSTKKVRSLLERYEAAGVDGVLVMYPGHTYVHEDGLRSYYERIADATDLGVVLFKRGPRLSLANVAALSERENVVCVKFAQNDVDLFATAVSETPGSTRSAGDRSCSTTCAAPLRDSACDRRPSVPTLSAGWLKPFPATVAARSNLRLA